MTSICWFPFISLIYVIASKQQRIPPRSPTTKKPEKENYIYMVEQYMLFPSHFLAQVIPILPTCTMQVQLEHKFWNSYHNLISFLFCLASTAPLLWSFFSYSAYWSHHDGPGYLKMVHLDNVPKSRAVPICPEMIVNLDACLDMSGSGHFC